MCGLVKRPVPNHRLHPIAGELMFQHIDLMIQGHMQSGHQVLGFDILLDAVGSAVEPALSPSGQVQHRFTQCLGWDRAGMDGNAADPAALLDHENGATEFGSLDGGAASGGAAAEDDEVVSGH